VFNKDVVIDMLCYRVHGHNEADEPTYTQPILYRKIEAKRSPRKLYTEALLRRGEMDPAEAERMLEDYRDRLQEAFERTKGLEPSKSKAEEGLELLRRRKAGVAQAETVETKAPREALEATVRALSQLPETLNVHKKLVRQFE